MPLLPPPSNEKLPPKGQEILQSMKMVPNIWRTMAYAPAVLKATLDLNEAMQHDLDPQLRELAYAKASTLNHCEYCLHYHKLFARKAGLSDEQIQNLGNYQASPVYNDLQKAVIQFAEQWTVKGKVENDVLGRLKQSLTPTQLIVLAATVGLANWTNRFNVTFGIELP
jgi:AhpD family alkylhydroperoxidase